jgi:signal transduction histidine kinase
MILERRDGSAVLIVEDDGVGLALGDGPGREGMDRGLGLTGMRERAALVGGTLEIESAPGAGTTVYARVPVSPHAEEEGEP